MTATKAWPTRDEWAQGRRTIYYGDEMPVEYLRAHDALVPDALRVAAVVELEALWSALRGPMRGAQAPAAEKLYRAGQISCDEWLARCDTPADAARTLRHEIRRDLRREWVRVPTSYDDGTACVPVLAQHPLRGVRQYVEACAARERAAYADWERAVRQRPVDDVAWEKELTRRARVDAYLSGDGANG